jgi:hypothetical protein
MHISNNIKSVRLRTEPESFLNPNFESDMLIRNQDCIPFKVKWNTIMRYNSLISQLSIQKELYNHHDEEARNTKKCMEDSVLKI